MATVDEIKEFVDSEIALALRAPHLYAQDANEIVCFLLGLETVRRFINGEKSPSRGYANRRDALGLPATISLKDYVTAQLKASGVSEPTAREVLKATCKFWEEEIIRS